MQKSFNLDIQNQKIFTFENNIELFIKREDQIHSEISGNKFRKLKYNIEEAKKLKKHTLITFGGAFSNHILAVAAVGNINQFKTIGIIRGEELSSKIKENPTLKKAQKLGMQFVFVSREAYQSKNVKRILEQNNLLFKNFYLIPEGGTNELGVKGCEEILNQHDKEYFSHICCAVGTGGTISGIINSSNSNQKILGFSSLKGNFLKKDINIFAKQNNWELISEYHFGGYGKINDELIEFINTFRKSYQVLLDPIYTAKMMFGIFDMIQNNQFKENTKILVIHTGGLQGIKGINQLLSQKNKTLIEE